MTQKNMDLYKTVYNFTDGNISTYNEKHYGTRQLASNDKRKVESRRTRKGPYFNKKYFLLTICFIIFFSIYGQTNYDNNSYTTAICYCFLLFMLFILIFHEVKSDYYFILIYAFIIIMLGTMGYGWLIIGMISNSSFIKKYRGDGKNNKLNNKVNNKTR